MKWKDHWGSLVSNSYINAHYVYVCLYTDTIIHLERFYTDTYILYTISILFPFQPLLMRSFQLCGSQDVMTMWPFQDCGCLIHLQLVATWHLGQSISCPEMCIEISWLCTANSPGYDSESGSWTYNPRSGSCKLLLRDTVAGRNPPNQLRSGEYPTFLPGILKHQRYHANDGYGYINRLATP